MHNIFKCYFLILVFLFFFPIVALADPYIEDDLGLWTPIYIQTPITKKVRLNLEVNPRIQENIRDVFQLLLRPSISYKLTENLSIWQGYAWVTFYNPRFLREQRIWQQILYEKFFLI